jgi:hypothetical protein
MPNIVNAQTLPIKATPKGRHRDLEPAAGEPDQQT